MNKNLYLIIFIFSILLGNVQLSDQVLAKVGEEVITLNDFIERSEYTPRPLYCNGNSNIEKRIILNSLIGEKLFSNEINDKTLPLNIDQYLVGRKNQKMREVLFNEITNSNIWPLSLRFP